MRDILWIIRKILTVLLRYKKNWLFIFGLPLIGIFASMLFYGSAGPMVLRVGIVNEDGSRPITQDAIRFVGSLNQVSAEVIARSDVQEKIASGKLDSAIVFDEGFDQSVRAGSPGHISIVSLKGAAVTGYMKTMLNSYIDNAAAIGKASKEGADFDKLYAAYRQQNFKLTAATLKDDSGRKYMTYQTIGYLITFMMFSAVTLSEQILKEREKRTYFRLLTTPVTGRAYVTANVLVNFLVMLLQILITLFFMEVVFRIDSGIPFWQMFTVLLLFALAAVGLSLAIVSFAASTTSAAVLQNLIIMPTCLLAGCFFPLDIMPESVRRLSDFVPQHWLLVTFDQLQKGAAFGSLYLNMIILIAFAAAFTLVAVYKFGRNNDARLFV